MIYKNLIDVVGHDDLICNQDYMQDLYQNPL